MFIADFISVSYNHQINFIKNKVKLMGKIKTIPELDKIVGGFFEGELVTIIGDAGDGKTTFAIAIANSIIHRNKNVLIVSLEATEEHIMEMINRANGVKSKEEVLKFYNKSDLGNLIVKKINPDSKFFDDFDKFIKHLTSKSEIDAIFIDTVGIVPIDAKICIIKLREITDKYQVSLFNIIQGRQRNYNKPVDCKEDIPQTTSIVAISDKVIGIRRDWDEKKENFFQKLFRIIFFKKRKPNFFLNVLKNRSDKERSGSGYFDFKNVKLKIY